MTSYFVIYAILWTLAMMRSVLRTENTRTIFLMQVILLAVFSSMRFETGYDWPVYGSHYVGEGVGASLTFEPGYELLARLFLQLGVPFQYYVSVITFLMVGALAYVIEKLIPDYKEIAVFIFFALPDFFLIPIFSVIRQTISLLLFLVGVIRFHDGRRRSAAFFVVAAFSFHYSTIIICLLATFFYRLKLTPKQYLVFFVAAFFMYLAAFDPLRFLLKVVIETVIPGYSAYLLRDTFNASLPYRIVSACIFFGLISLVWKSWSLKGGLGSNGKIFYKNTALLALILPIALFNFPTFTSRFMFFGSFFIVGFCLYCAHNVIRLSRPLVTVCLGVVLILPLYRFLASPLSSPYVPYQNMIQVGEANSTGAERTQELLDMLDSLW